jgi:glycosyltransferase involved in cell wall biosynthesis
VPRKNPLVLAEVLRDMGVPGVFIGGVSQAEKAYGDSFEKVVGAVPSLLWIRGLAHDDPILASAYSAAAVFCLPSSAEVQSASALEAMAAGRPIVLGEHALRCRPDRPDSIRRAIETALAAPEEHAVRLPESFTWLNVARATAAVYEEILR